MVVHFTCWKDGLFRLGRQEGTNLTSRQKTAYLVLEQPLPLFLFLSVCPGVIWAVISFSRYASVLNVNVIITVPCADISVPWAGHCTLVDCKNILLIDEC